MTRTNFTLTRTMIFLAICALFTGCGAEEAAPSNSGAAAIPNSGQNNSNNDLLPPESGSSLDGNGNTWSDPGKDETQHSDNESNSSAGDNVDGENQASETANNSDENNAPMFPVGESGESDDNGDSVEIKDKDQEDSSDEYESPTTGTGESTEEKVAKFAYEGWSAASTPAEWTKAQMDPYPHALPERPRALKNPEYFAWSSGRTIAVHHDSLFVIDTEAGSLVVLDRVSGKVKRMIAVGKRPQQVVVDPTGTAYVTLRYGSAVVRILPNESQISKLVKVGTEPYGLALSPDTNTLYVSVSGSNRVVALDTKTMIPISNVPVERRPRGLSINSFGDLYVTHQYGSATRFETDPISGSLLDADTIPLRTNNPADVALHLSIKLDKQVANRAYAAATNPETQTMYAAQMLANPGSEEQTVTELLDKEAEKEEKCETTCSLSCKQECKQSCQQVCATQGYYGGTVCTNSCSQNCKNVCNDVCNTTCVMEVKTFPHLIRPVEVSVTSFPAGEKLNAMSVEQSPPVMDPFSGEPMTAICDQPMDAHHHPKHSLLFVVCQGTDNILVLNSASADPMRSPVAEIKVGKAPNGIAFSTDGNIAYVRNAHSFTVSDVDLSALFDMEAVPFSKNAAGSQFTNWGQFGSKGTLTKPITLLHGVEAIFGSDPLDEQKSLGRRIFTFARYQGLSDKGFFACSSCHAEGTEDGLVWFTKEGVRQTPMLAGKLKGTAPFNWVGTGKTLPENIWMTVKRMGGTGISKEERVALAEFLMDSEALPAPPNQYVAADGSLTESQLKGQQLFYSQTVGCADCHAGSSLTDGENWDVGTFTKLELETNGDDIEPLNTPSLRGLHYTAPYLHDGSVKTLKELLNSSAETMGTAYQLTAKQQDYLIDYLLTL